MLLGKESGKIINKLVDSDRSLARKLLTKIKDAAKIIDATFKGDGDTVQTLKLMREAEKRFTDALAASGTGYYHGKEHARKEAQKQESKRFNEFNTLAMQWAFSDKTQVGERTIRYRKDDAVIIEKTENGYIEIASPKNKNYKDIWSEINEHNDQIGNQSVYESAEGYEFERRNGSRDNVVDGRRDGQSGRDGRVYQEQSERNGNGTYQQGVGNQSEIKESRRGYAGRNPSDVTEQEYNHHYWAVANDVLSTKESGALRSAVGAINQGEYYPQTSDGKYMVAVGENGVLNKIVFTDGGQDSYSVDKVIEINSDNETDLDRIRGVIYESEAVGISTEDSSILKVNKGTAFPFVDFDRKRSQDERNSYVEQDGRRSGAETENRTGNEVKHSLRGNGYIGHSMSVNAKNAYGRGEMPISKWTKSAIAEEVSAINPDLDISQINLPTLKKEFLRYEGWHHTGQFYSVTDFYSINIEKINGLTQSDVDEIVLHQSQPQQVAQVKSKDKDAISKVEDAYSKISLIVDTGIMKTENGVVKRILSGKDINVDYQKALNIIKDEYASKVDAWRKLPKEHWRQEYVKLYDTDMSAFALRIYPPNKLSKNSNLFKSLYTYYNDSPDIRYSRRSFDEQVDAVLNGADTISTHLKVRDDTPKLLVDIGLDNKPILMTAKHTKTAVGVEGVKGNKHHLSAETLKKLPELLDNPAIVMESTKEGSVVMFVNAVDGDNNPVLCAIKVDGDGYYNDIIIDANVVTSIYGKDTNPVGFISKAVDDGRLLYWDKKMSQTLLSIPGLQLPDNITKFDSNTIIRKISRKSTGDDKIKHSLRLTPAKSIENIVNWKLDRRSIIHDEREYYVSVPKASALFADKQSKQFLSQMMHMANDSSEPNRAKFADEFAQHILDRVLVLNGNAEMKSIYKEWADLIKPYRKSLDLTHIMGELTYIYGKKEANNIRLVWGAPKYGHATSIDDAIMELRGYGVPINSDRSRTKKEPHPSA